MNAPPRGRRAVRPRGFTLIPTALAAALLSAAGLWTSFPAAVPLSAQQVEREEQVPLAPERGVLEIDRALRARLDLFPEAAGFQAARLFLRADGTAVLEVEAFRDGRRVRERTILDEAGLAELRDQLQARFAALDDAAFLDREGRGGLVLRQTLLGLAFHGWAVPVVLDIESSQGQVAAYLLTAGASFYLPYRLTRSRSVSEVHRDMAAYGGTRGIAYGLLLGDAVAGDWDDDERASRFRLATAAGTSWAGSVAGFAVAEALRPDDGTQALWARFGDFGLVGGALAAYVAGPYENRVVEVRDGDIVYSESHPRSRVLGHSMTMAGGAAGLLAGHRLGRRSSYTEGNVTALTSTAVLGLQAGLTLGDAVGLDDRPLAAAALAGGVGGVAGGHLLLRNRRFTNGEGLLLAAAHVAGGATALGITYLVVEEVEEHSLLYLAASTAGSALGFGLVWRALGEGTAPAFSGGARSGMSSPSGRSPSVEIRPAAAVLSVLGAGLERGRPGAVDPGSVRRAAVRSSGFPVVTIRF